MTLVTITIKTRQILIPNPHTNQSASFRIWKYMKHPKRRNPTNIQKKMSSILWLSLISRIQGIVLVNLYFHGFPKPWKEKNSDQRWWNRSYQQVLFLIMICKWRPTQWLLRTTICYGYCNPRRWKQKGLLYRWRIPFVCTHF